jgi:hypothetical protein
VDFTAEEIATWQAVQPFTMTSPERIVSLVRAVEYLVRNSIAGDVVECGVWRGGSMMAAALTLLRLGDQTRDLHLFDTYEGMTEPTDHDFTPKYGKSAREVLADGDKPSSQAWAVAPIDQVKSNVRSTTYPDDRVKFVQGAVEATLPAHAPPRIALLRLDTDWYESTRHELVHLFPRLVSGGVLIVDDYGHWAGAKKAVDEYLSEENIPLLLCRIDYTARIAVKR